MNPIMRHLQQSINESPYSVNGDVLAWTFTNRIKTLDLAVYRALLPQHLNLNLEYSVLRHQLRDSLSTHVQINKEVLIEQLIAALSLAELLEHLHAHYLNVPREVRLFQQQQRLYKTLLSELAGYSFASQDLPPDERDIGWSLSQKIRQTTLNNNWYRLILMRTKRLLNLINQLDTVSARFKQAINFIDYYSNPVLPYLGWCYLTPRLLTNLYLLVKHTLPGPWMSEEEEALGWTTRLHAQLQRRWFELGNDTVWVSIGIVNCFILVGALAFIGAYINVAFFSYDIILSVLRASFELKRLYRLQDDYKILIDSPGETNKQGLIDFQNHLKLRIEFDLLRLGLQIATTILIFIAMCFAIPAFAMSTLIPLSGAILMVGVCLASFTLMRILESYRPNDTVEIPTPKSPPEPGEKKTQTMNPFGFFQKATSTESHSNDIPLLAK